MEDITRLVDHIPGPTAIKGDDMKFVYWNKEFGQLAGIVWSRNRNGLTDYDLQNGFALHADIYRQHDRHALNYNVAFSELSVIQMASGCLKAYLINRKPFTYRAISPNYVIVNMLDVSAMNLYLFERACDKDGTKEHRGRDGIEIIKYGSAEQKSDLMMTRREREILYYLLRGGTARCIASSLKISHRTVEQHIGTLKDKFFANTKSELIQKALHLGYLYLVPQPVT